MRASAARAAPCRAPRSPPRRPIRSSSIPDVRRTLAAIKGFNIAARALVLSTALAADIAHRSPEPAERQAADDRVGLLTPVVKGVLTDRGFDNCVAAQQVFGGHGYIAEHGMEQFVRDARIAMLYEGTNGIQALDLVGRKLPKDGGRAILAFFAEVGDFVREHGDAEPRPLRRSAQGRARRSREGDQLVHAQRHRQAGKRRRRRDRLHAPLRPGGARPHVGEDRRRRLPRRRILAIGRAFVERALPETALRLARITAGADGLMAIPEAAF